MGCDFSFFCRFIRLSLLLLPLVIGLSGCGRDRDERLNILFVSIDTLRADHLGCYGYDRNTSPNLDRLAREGILFEQAISASPWTLPSHMSIMTSLYPEQHKRAWKSLFPDQPLTTLADVLSAQGYQTQGFVAVPFLKEVYGFGQGFSGYEFEQDISAEDQTDKAITWLNNNRHDENPLFLFVHYFDPHVPYLPPEAYREKFIAGMKDFPLDTNIFKASFTEEEKRFLQALYDAEIQYTDDHLGRLLKAFYDQRNRENSLVIVFSDHGEEFWDHGGVDHGHTLYDELIRVPLIISAPGHLPSALTLKNTVRTIDLMPTMLDLCGLPVPDTCRGVSLLDYIRTGTPPDISAFSSAVVKGPEQKSIRTDQHKFIYNTLTLKPSLFDLEKDPQERLDRIDAEPGIAASFQAEMDQYLSLSFLAWRLMMVTDGEDRFTGRLQTDGVFLDVDVRKLAVKKSNERTGKRQKKLLQLPEREREAEGEEINAEVVLSEDRKILDLDFSDARTPYLLSFNLSPDRAKIECELRMEPSSQKDLIFLGSELKHAGASIFTVSPDEVAVSDPRFKPPMDHRGFYLWRVIREESGRKEVALDSETMEQLRALGYMDVSQ